MKIFKPMLVLLLASSIPPLLAEEHRQHGAHEHGVGRLDIAREGAELHIELDSPAVNIVGFEHAPKNEADHETLEKGLARLKDGSGLFQLPEAAGCRLLESDVDTPLQEHDAGKEDHDSEHEHHADDKHHAEEKHGADAADHEHDHEGETHADITATWRFSCAHPEALDQIKVRLFEAFPLTERLQVQFIGDQHQGAAEISASQPVLRF